MVDSITAKPTIKGGSDSSWTANLLSKENGNIVLVPVLLLSFIPYFLPDGVLPPEVAKFWSRAPTEVSRDVFPSN